jgi:hypothetical protein
MQPGRKKHHPIQSQTLILSPPIAAGHALVETRHGLIGTSNLHLEERSFVTITPICRTLHTTLLRIVPRTGTTKDVFLLFALEDASREDGLCNCVFKGTRAAFEAIGALVCERDGEDVGALGADCKTQKHPLLAEDWSAEGVPVTYRAASCRPSTQNRLIRIELYHPM